MNRAFCIVAVSLVFTLPALSAFADDALDEAPFSDPKYDRFRSDAKAISMLEGHLALFAGDYRAALSYFDEVRHSDIVSHVNRAQELSDKGHADGAIAKYDQAIQLESDPDNLGWFYFSRGCAWASKGRLDRALDDYSEAIRLRPRFVAAYSARGTAWYNSGAYEKAITDLDEAIRLDPRHATSFWSFCCRGLCWAGIGNTKRAIADLDEAVRLNVRAAQPIYYRGFVLHSDGDDQRAIIDYDQAVQLDPKNSSMQDAIALVLASSPNEHVRDAKRAIELATHACQLSDWKNPVFISTLAAAYAESGDFGVAIEWQSKALEMTLGDPALQAMGHHRLELYKRRKPYRELRQGQTSNDVQQRDARN